MSELLNNPAFLILLGAIPSFVLGILSLGRTGKVDKATAQSLIFDAMDKHTENLQEDNKSLREGMAECRDELKKLIGEVALLKKALAKDIADNPRY